MMKQMQRVLAMLLTAVLLAGLLPVSVLASGGEIQPGERVIQSVAAGRDCGAVLTGGGAVWYLSLIHIWIDFSSCVIERIAASETLEEFRGAVINPMQAADLVVLLGIQIL